MELTELCKELNNWFDQKRYFGKITIENGALKDDFGLLENQYYRIVDSVFNDGVHKFKKSLLKDEIFDGAVWAMAVPPEVIALVDKINDYEMKYGEAISSPYQSESFGGYSYTKSSGSASGEAGKGSGGVLAAFSDELNRWRKV